MHKLIFCFLSTALVYSCMPSISEEFKTFEAQNEAFEYGGRIEKIGDSAVALISSGAWMKTMVSGDSCILFMKGENTQHHYVALELNGDYIGRFKIKGEPIKLKLPDSIAKHSLAVYKDTEASNGKLIFKGVSAENIQKPASTEKPKIEFIGNSITCGMGADTKEIPCGEGEWYDQHNAYLAYGPRVARALNVDFKLSCVSGMGMYRNWNDEDQPVMPDVYENLYLNNNSGKKADFSKDPPDIVSIALGTNDLSKGDGKKERSDFSQQKFTDSYIKFVKMIYGHYPDVKIALLTSPMMGKEDRKILLGSLQKVKNHFSGKNISIFEFGNITPNGCTGHPNIQDHQEMAEMLVPFFKNLLNEK